MPARAGRHSAVASQPETSSRVVRDDRPRTVGTSARAERGETSASGTRVVREEATTSGTRAVRDSATTSAPLITSTRRTLRVPARSASAATGSEVSRTASRGSLRPAEPKVAPKAAAAAPVRTAGRPAEPKGAPPAKASAPARRSEPAAATERGSSGSPSSQAIGVARPEKPLICLDWHNTVSFRDNRSGENFIPERSKQVLRRCQALGFDLAVCSFASNLATQRDVLNSARQLERELSRPFTFVHIVCRKFLRDPPTSRPSITGCVTCKAEEITRTGAAIFIDDQRDLLAEVEDLQRGRASQNRCRTLISHRTRPSAALEELERLLEEDSPGDFGLPSFLRALR